MDGDLARAWKKIKKHRGWDDAAGIARDMRDTMVRNSPVPRDMGEEMAAYFLAEPVDEEAVYKAEEILELMGGTWTSVDSALDDDDWDFLKDLVNDWAVDMDMDVVNDIMRAVVDRGDFHDR